MDRIKFCTPVYYVNHPKSVSQAVLELVDGYFYLGGKVAEVIPGLSKEGAEPVKLVDSKITKLTTVLKVASYFTVVIPLIMLLAKAILRCCHRFYIHHKDRSSITEIEPHSKKQDRSQAQSSQIVFQRPETQKKFDQDGKDMPKIDAALKTERQKKIAAIQIQSAFRGYKARHTLRKLKAEKIAKTLSAATKVQKQKARPLIEPSKEVQTIPVPDKAFRSFSLNLHFSDSSEKKVKIGNFNEAEALLKDIHERVNRENCWITVYIDWGNDPKDIIAILEKTESAKPLKFKIPEVRLGCINIQAKPTKTETLADGKTRYSYANGVIQTLDTNGKGTRLFPNGKKEQGKFDNESNQLISGYRIEADGRIEYFDPRTIANYTENKEEIRISEIEGKLVVLKKIYRGLNAAYEVVNISLENFILKACNRKNRIDPESIKEILLHKDFDQHRKEFIKSVLSANETGIPKIFSFSEGAAIDILEVGSKIIEIDPLKIIDTKSGINFFIQAAIWGSKELLSTLIKLFPKAFKLAGQSVIGTFLENKHHSFTASNLFDEFKKIGGVLDTFHRLLLKVAQGIEPSESFKKEFSELTREQQQKLYQTAFDHNNTFIREPADVPVRADQYSINLMWINKNEMPPDQEFLFGDGETTQARRADFHKRFIEPVAKWAKANPGSVINIWVDKEMATPDAIERSRALLEKSLEGTAHGKIQFRDVRTIDVVQANRRVFSERMPIYFRVDLLRAIAADYTLRKKETKYFVYGDIDMEPLSGEELFDKRTINYLNDLGFVMAKGGFLGFENGFQILSGDHALFLDSHRKVIIDNSVETANKYPDSIKEQQIYDTYPAMMTHLFDADGRFGHFEAANNLSEKEKLKLFRYNRFELAIGSKLPLGDKKVRLSNVAPMKPVRLPRSHFGI